MLRQCLSVRPSIHRTPAERIGKDLIFRTTSHNRAIVACGVTHSSPVRRGLLW